MEIWVPNGAGGTDARSPEGPGEPKRKKRKKKPKRKRQLGLNFCWKTNPNAPGRGQRSAKPGSTQVTSQNHPANLQADEGPRIKRTSGFNNNHQRRTRSSFTFRAQTPSGYHGNPLNSHQNKDVTAEPPPTRTTTHQNLHPPEPPEPPEPPPTGRWMFRKEHQAGLFM